MKNYVCIDIGGTSIKYGVINEELDFLVTNEMDTEAKKGGENILNKIIEIVTMYKDDYKIDGICISTAGMVDCEKGEIIHSSSLIPNYTGTKIKSVIEEKFNIQCEVENDVNCAALAEHFAGGAKGSNISLCLTIGTGIGGAIIVNNEVYHGAFGSGGEVGYMNMMGSTFQDLGASSVLVKKVAKMKGISEKDINGKYITSYFFFLLLFRAVPAAYEVPSLGVQLELQLPAYATATATRNPSRVCDVHHSSWQCH